MTDVKTIFLSAEVIFTMNLTDLFIEIKLFSSHEGKMASKEPNSVKKLKMHNKYIKSLAKYFQNSSKYHAVLGRKVSYDVQGVPKKSHV